MNKNLRAKYKKYKKVFYRKLKYVNLFDARFSFPENKFVIYTRGRTGSTVLTDLINCHPDIYCDVEIFNFMYSNNKVAFPQQYIKSCSKRASVLNKSTYGFKVKISQLKNEHKYKNYEGILFDLFKDGWKFIYLKRENYLRHEISNMMAAESKIFHLKGDEKPYEKKIHVEGTQLLDAIKFGEEIERTEEENLKNIPHLTIVYEKDLLDNSKHQETADRIFDFLGLKKQAVKTNFKRVTPEDLKETIINFEDVYNFFKGTKYSDLLK